MGSRSSDKNNQLTDIVKVTSGSNPFSLNIIDKLYKPFDVSSRIRFRGEYK